MLTWAIAGYLTGMIIGFTLFDPNNDIYAILGAILALAGLIMGLSPSFYRQTHIVSGGLMGFYIGALIGIVLAGNAGVDNLLEVTRNKGELLFALIGAGIGGGLAAKFASKRRILPLAAALFGGFGGGLVLSGLLGMSRNAPMLHLSPLVLVSGVVLGGAVYWLQERFVYVYDLDD
jgi:hypothetical protein